MIVGSQPEDNPPRPYTTTIEAMIFAAQQHDIARERIVPHLVKGSVEAREVARRQ